MAKTKSPKFTTQFAKKFATQFAIEAPVTLLEGVGSKTAGALAKLNIHTLEDLFFYVPRRYEDRRKLTPLKNLVPGQNFCAIAKVIDCEIIHDRTEAVISDETNEIKIVWFTSKIGEFLSNGMNIALYGQASEFGGRIQVSHPKFEILRKNKSPTLIGNIVPIYSASSDITQNNIIKIINQALDYYSKDCLIEFLPQKILDKYGMMSFHDAIMEMHRPHDNSTFIRARNRLAFDELFLLQCGILLRRNFYLRFAKKSITIKPGKYYEAFQKSLKFEMTNAQKRVIKEIFKDLDNNSSMPMNRLLQGDVGSGKTLVAFSAILAAIDSGVQAAFMAPTEILAGQHFIKLQKSLEPLGLRAELLTGSLKQSEKNKILESLENGEINIIVGTHSIFAERVKFKELGLVIIDEQHRFGVLQRNALTSKGIAPHVLSMTATPIPRTIVMSVYGDLEVSVIDEMPPGRKKIKTISLFPQQFNELKKIIRQEISKNHQIYWVCPTIEEGERGLSAVTSRYDEITKLFPDVKIAMLHGQMSGDEKNNIMKNFSDGKIHMLISTIVIEVGVDVPNATLMIIEDAGQFGLAQLHQLRGRIGRGQAESTCVLLESAATTEEGHERISIMTKTSDGFELSEADLIQRGPGEVCGTHQHGVTDFRIADLVRDVKILKLAKNEANEIITQDPELTSETNLKKELLRRLANTLELAITA